ncbi:unnamed protein product [Rhizophagus irregularis]|nr:unnamed protein product [Rhizophagus irregularis]
MQRYLTKKKKRKIVLVKNLPGRSEYSNWNFLVESLKKMNLDEIGFHAQMIHRYMYYLLDGKYRYRLIIQFYYIFAVDSHEMVTVDHWVSVNFTDRFFVIFRS